MSTELGPDEKICPFCAEVIRAAAVKCRYCHSDLPPTDGPAPDPVAPFPAAGTAHDIRETPPVPPAPAAVAPAESTSPQETQSSARPDIVPTVLLAVCVMLALGIGLIWWSARSDDLATAGNGQVTSESYRSAALSAGSANITTILSYSYKTLDEDEKAARAVISSGYAKQYAEVMAKSGPEAKQAKLTQKATVAASSLISLTGDRARLMLFVDRTTTAEGSQRQVAYSDRLIVEMRRHDGDWIVSKVTPF